MADETQSSAGAFDVRMRGFRARAEVADVARMLLERVAPLPGEWVDLHDAAGRVLADAVVSAVDVPGFDRAAMDGYALRAEETFGAGAYAPLEFAVLGSALPGRPFGGIVETGQAVRIMTGAPVPAGADAVLPAEAAAEKEGRLFVQEPVPPGRNIGRQGEDVRADSVLFLAGRRLRPQDVGLLSSVGCALVFVVRRPAVALIVTGGELLAPGTKPEGFKIVDSNSVMLDALIKRDGGTVSEGVWIADGRDEVEAAFRQVQGDVILVSGGSSVGQEDHAPRILAQLGELTAHGLALRPASPAGVGFLNGRPVILLPGNPVSCLCAYDFLAGPVVRKLGARAPAWPYPVRRLPLARKLASAVGRVDYVRVRIVDNQVEPLAIGGASILSSTSRADGFVIVERDSEGAPAGAAVDVYLYDSES